MSNLHYTRLCNFQNERKQSSISDIFKAFEQKQLAFYQIFLSNNVVANTSLDFNIITCSIPETGGETVSELTML